MQPTQDLEDLLDGKELVVTDFAHTLIRPDKYNREAEKFLAKHGGKKVLRKVRQRKFGDAKDVVKNGKDLVSNHNDLPPEVRTRTILKIINEVDEGAGESFGRALSNYIDQNVLNFLTMCYNVNDRIQRALVSFDGYRAVKPTLDKLDTMGLPIHKYIVNQVVTVGGKFTDMLISYANGVLNWDQEPLWTKQDKLNAFKALTYPFRPSQIIYIHDGAKQEEGIDKYQKRGGGISLKSYELPKFIAPTLV